MDIRKVFFGCAMLLAVAGCHNDGLTAEQRAVRKAAESVVSALCEGNTDALVASTAYADSSDASYRAIIADIMADQIAAMKVRRGGITSFEATRDSILGNAAQVFVVLHFADSTAEEIDIPLTLVGEQWCLR